MALTRSTFSVGGTALNQGTTRWVTSEQKLHGAQNITYAQVTLPGREGDIPLPASRSTGAAEWILSISIQGSTYAQVMDRKAALEAILMPFGRMVTIRETFATGGKVLEAQGFVTETTVDRPWQSAVDGVDLSYTFRIPAGVWWEPETSFTVSGTGTTSYPAATGGSAPQTATRVEFTPSSGAARFAIASSGGTDSVLRLAGSGLTTGTSATIEGSTLRAVQGSTNIASMVDVGTTQFHINPDGVLVVSEFSGISSMKVYTRKAWY